MMPEDDPYTAFVAARAQQPPLTSGDPLYWDGMGAPSRRGAGTPVSEPGASAAGPTRESGLLPSPPARTIDWVTEAAGVTFYLEPALLLPTVHGVSPGATGTLLWVHGTWEATCLTPTVHPALLVHTASEALHVPYVELVPHLRRHDPLLRHMALVLQAAVEAEGVAGGLYAEVVANALAAHLLRRAALSRPHDQACHGGLTPPKLHHTIAYMWAHLEHTLSLAELADVAQMSPTRFAHLFKDATGQTPHQYVMMCRMARAKHLLTETTLPLHEIGAQVGYGDQSHFTALFRRYVTTTPKAHRDATSRA
jgi:AraC-like DNA-binding protein